MTEAIQLAERAGFARLCSTDPTFRCTGAEVETLVRLAQRHGRAEAMQLLRAEMNNPLNGPKAQSVAHGVFGQLKKLNDAFDAELAAARACTCHPDDNPPVPCAQKFAHSDCVAAAKPFAWFSPTDAAQPVVLAYQKEDLRQEAASKYSVPLYREVQS